MILALLTISIAASMFAIVASLGMVIEHYVEVKRIGGLHFVRIGRLSGSFCVRGRNA